MGDTTQITKQGIILLTVPTTTDKLKGASIARSLETGFITFASIGAISVIFRPFQVWAELLISRDEGLTGFFYGTICQGYLSASNLPWFTGRIPLFPGDEIRLGAIADIATTVAATIRFERS